MKRIDNLYDYSFEDFIESLRKSGIQKGDTIFCHSNIAFFGKPLFENPNHRNAADLILSAIFEIIGKSGTLVLPSYTYSFCYSNIFQRMEVRFLYSGLHRTLLQLTFFLIYPYPFLICFMIFSVFLFDKTRIISKISPLTR